MGKIDINDFFIDKFLRSLSKKQEKIKKNKKEKYRDDLSLDDYQEVPQDVFIEIEEESKDKNFIECGKIEIKIN